MTWMTLPPRARAALDRIAFGSALAEHAEPVFLTAVRSPKGTARWSLTDASASPDQTLADGGIAPLVRVWVLKGLGDGRLELMPLGRDLYAEYRRRRDTGDLLPLEGFR